MKPLEIGIERLLDGIDLASLKNSCVAEAWVPSPHESSPRRISFGGGGGGLPRIFRGKSGRVGT